MKPPSIHSGPPSSAPSSVAQRARVAGQHERAQRSGHHIELVQRDQRAEGGERRRATSRRARPGRARRQDPDDRDENARDEVAHRPPKRRRRRRVLGERAAQVALAEVRPERVDEHELGVGDLPEQEVRDPQLAGRADEQVGVGQLRRVQLRGERVLVDLLRRARRLDQPARRLDELGAAAVVEGDPE